MILVRCDYPHQCSWQCFRVQAFVALQMARLTWPLHKCLWPCKWPGWCGATCRQGPLGSPTQVTKVDPRKQWQPAVCQVCSTDLPTPTPQKINNISLLNLSSKVTDMSTIRGCSQIFPTKSFGESVLLCEICSGPIVYTWTLFLTVQPLWSHITHSHQSMPIKKALWKLTLKSKKYCYQQSTYKVLCYHLPPPSKQKKKYWFQPLKVIQVCGTLMWPSAEPRIPAIGWKIGDEKMSSYLIEILQLCAATPHPGNLDPTPICSCSISLDHTIGQRWQAQKVVPLTGGCTVWALHCCCAVVCWVHVYFNIIEELSCPALWEDGTMSW